jgi:hypothetical protein
MRRNSPLLVFVAAFAVLFAAWLWWSGDQQAREELAAAQEARSSAPAPKDEPAIAAPEPETTTAPEETDRRTTPTAAATTSAPKPPRRPKRKVWLGGSVVQGLAGVADASVLVVAAPPDAPVRPSERVLRHMTKAFDVTGDPEVSSRSFAFGAAGTTDANGDFRIDLSRLETNESRDSLRMLWIRVSDARGRSSDYDLPLMPDDLPLWPADPKHGRADELDLDVQLKLGTGCRVTASARVADGVADSESDVEGDSVHLLALEFNGERATSPRRPHHFWTTPDNRRPGIELTCGVEYVLVAYASGYRPHSQRFVAASGLDLGDIVLDRGETISGHVRMGGENVQGALRVELANAGELINTADRFAWREGRVEWFQLTVSSDEAGAFRIEGLAPELYNVSIHSLRGGLATPGAITEVRAPAVGVEFAFGAARVELRVFNKGAPVANFLLQVHERSAAGGSGGAVRTDANGVALVWVHSDRTTSVSYEVRPNPQDKPQRRELPLHFPGVGQRSVVRIDL